MLANNPFNPIAAKTRLRVNGTLGLRMERWKDVELYERGLKQFQSLSPLQRDWFTIKTLDVYFEMEGSFDDYLLSGGNEPELAWLESALRRLGDIVSLGFSQGYGS